MVHTYCKLGRNQRGIPTTEFYKDGKPQIYCFGVIDRMYDEYLPECQSCPDWVHGEQCEKDFQEAMREEGK